MKVQFGRMDCRLIQPGVRLRYLEKNTPKFKLEVTELPIEVKPAQAYALMLPKKQSRHSTAKQSEKRELRVTGKTLGRSPQNVQFKVSCPVTGLHANYTEDLSAGGPLISEIKPHTMWRYYAADKRPLDFIVAEHPKLENPDEAALMDDDELGVIEKYRIMGVTREKREPVSLVVKCYRDDRLIHESLDRLPGLHALKIGNTDLQKKPISF